MGLKRHTVRVVEHDSTWLSAGQAESRALLEAGGNLILDARHVGSTSVPDLPAKPILDIAVLVETDAAMPELISRLTAAGYIYRGVLGDEGEYLFVRESQPDVRLAHVHVLCKGDRGWENYMLFREALCNDAALRLEYASLKASLANLHADNRKAYTHAKDAFIRGVLDRFK